MSKAERFFRGMAMLCLGVIIGFLISPIKQGIRVSIGSNNKNSRLMNEGDDWEDWYDDSYYDEDEDTVYEHIEEEEAPSDSEESSEEGDIRS